VLDAFSITQPVFVNNQVLFCFKIRLQFQEYLFPQLCQGIPLLPQRQPGQPAVFSMKSPDNPNQHHARIANPGNNRCS
jgi:hypothetical protein